MRVLLPFYKPDSSESSASSSDEEEEQKSSVAGIRKKKASSPLAENVSAPAAGGERAVLENPFDFATKEPVSNTARKTKKCKTKHSDDAKPESQKAEDDEDGPKKLPSKSTVALPEDSARLTKANQSSLLPSLGEFAPCAASNSQESNPKKRSAKEGPSADHEPAPIESGAVVENPQTKILPPPTVASASISSVSLKPSPKSATNNSAFSSAAAIKRPRTDLKPPAKDLSKPPPPPVGEDIKTMAVGGKHRGGDTSSSDDDEEEETPPVYADHPANFWVEPAENEPPVMQNQPPPAAALVATASSAVPAQSGSNPDDPAQDFVLPEMQDQPQKEEQQLLPAAAKQQPEPAEQEPSLDEFRETLKKQGLEMIEQAGDGNCLFRAVSLQVYGQSNNHAEVRERCLDFMAQNEEHYSNFVAATDEDRTFQDYIARKRRDGVHGNHAEIQAVSELYNRPVEVYSVDTSSPSCKPMNIFHAEYKTSDPPIRLSYHDGNHYNAVVDPLVPTAGMGLGLPDLKPGLADKMQLNKAKSESDQYADEMELERVLKESKAEFSGARDDELQRVLKESSMDYMYAQKAMAFSDLDDGEALLQEALASSMESYRRNEHGRKQRASPVGRRRGQRQSPPVPLEPPAEAASMASYSMYASVPPVASAAAAAAPSVASAPSAASVAASAPSGIAAEEEYPQTVQELVMNGFELSKVIHAFDLIGDNFDDLLAFLLSSSSSAKGNR